MPRSIAILRARGDAATLPPCEAAGFPGAAALGAAAAAAGAGAALGALAAGAAAGALAGALLGATKSLNAAMSPSSCTNTQRS